MVRPNLIPPTSIRPRPPPSPSLSGLLFRSIRSSPASTPALTPRGRLDHPHHFRPQPRLRLQQLRPISSSCPSSSNSKPSTTQTVLGREYKVDDYTNVPASILKRLTPNPDLPYKPNHPLQLLRSQIESHFGSNYHPMASPFPVVTTTLNFEDLGFPDDHPGRSPTDTYYLNRQNCLRTHTSAHEVETFAKGEQRWLLTADVYRRDEIDSSHYPIFHQMEGASIFSHEDYRVGGKVQTEVEEMESRLSRSKLLEIEDEVDLKMAGDYQKGHDPRMAALAVRHLKATLNGLVLELFGERHRFETSGGATGSQAEPLKVRWIPATFPFTSPSYEVEVWFRGKWLEILGCGVVMERTLERANVEGKLGWAFGLGLERIAMVLYSIPDIRLFWTEDKRFLDQFQTSTGGGAKRTSDGGLITFKPYSKFPPCYKDVSFWLPQTSTTTTSSTSPSSSSQGQGTEAKSSSSSSSFHENDFFEVVRDTVGDLAEDVVKIDDFTHPKTSRRSLCYRINYRSMDRNLENEETNALHSKVVERLVNELKLEIR
ncbi:phenylalanyl-tRNA synthetase [Violaceomyces palustris]|uniref:Phenylalanyl-tRNA synthetase n=1 Tax=Violaceomyces palustris TaxID=1673888 RepID=A0ACD0P2A8_9BASI|nr:phenylalanyl-tRNA synthetase [Violaceomyces palustris]